jgi:hypothetical protein
MAINTNQAAFDPKTFLAIVGEGKAILEFHKDQVVFAQGSRVSFFMNKFRKLGLISYNGKIEVNSSLLNAVLYDKPQIKREP